MNDGWKGAITQECQDRDKFSWRETRGSLCVAAPTMWFSRGGSSRPSVARLPVGVRSRAPADGAAAPDASSDGNGNRFFNDSAAVRTMGDRTVGFEHHHQRLFQVSFGFCQRSALRVHAGDFLNVAEVPLAPFQIRGSELANHHLTSSCGESLAYGEWRSKRRSMIAAARSFYG